MNDIPYCDTASNAVFQTNVTSQEWVACKRHERNAESGLPPTANLVSGIISHKLFEGFHQRALVVSGLTEVPSQDKTWRNRSLTQDKFKWVRPNDALKSPESDVHNPLRPG